MSVPMQPGLAAAARGAGGGGAQGGRLPPERRERLLRAEAERRREPLCAYALLLAALRRRCGWRSFPAIDRAPGGKPYFPDHPEVCFSLSHTRGAVLVGVGDTPLGVDVEKLRPVSGRFMRRLADTDDPEVFFQEWVRREAAAKRSGIGIGAMMGPDTAEPFHPGERYLPLRTFEGFVAGLSCAAGETPEEVRRYTLDTLM